MSWHVAVHFSYHAHVLDCHKFQNPIPFFFFNWVRLALAFLSSPLDLHPSLNGSHSSQEKTRTYFFRHHIYSFFRREGRLILNLDKVHPQITHEKNLKYKIHNILSRFFHRLLPQWLPSNVEAKVQSLCQIRWPTPKHWTCRKIQRFGTNPKRI